MTQDGYFRNIFLVVGSRQPLNKKSKTVTMMYMKVISYVTIIIVASANSGTLDRKTKNEIVEPYDFKYIWEHYDDFFEHDGTVNTNSTAGFNEANNSVTSTVEPYDTKYIWEHYDDFFGHDGNVNTNRIGEKDDWSADPEFLVALRRIFDSDGTIEDKGLPSETQNSRRYTVFLVKLNGTEKTIVDKADLILPAGFNENVDSISSEDQNTSDTNMTEINIGTRIGLEPTYKRNDDFQFEDIDWDQDQDDQIMDAKKEFDLKPRDHDVVNGPGKVVPLSDDRVIVSYPLEELDPRIDETTRNPEFDPRFDNNGTDATTEGVIPTTTEDISEEVTIIYDGNDREQTPIECLYGHDAFPIPKPKVEKSGRRVADIKCEEQMLMVKYNVDDVLQNSLICDKKRGVSHLLGGSLSDPGDFPHMGALGWLTAENTHRFFCGTSLLSSKYSITAAHCRSLPTRGDYNVVDIRPKIVRFGNVNIYEAKRLDVTIGQFITLAAFDAQPTKKYNDIALLRFIEEVQFSQYVKPACLWYESMNRLTIGNVTGWGKTVADRQDSLSDHLRFAEVDFLDRSTCTTHLNTRVNRNWNGLSEGQFCAGKLVGGVDTCQGDSGGPLQIRRSILNDYTHVNYVVGITSFGFDCGKPKLPGLYTSVRHYLCWIEKTVWPSENNTMCN